MTGRERLQRILDRRPVDRLAWTTLVDDRTLSAMPEDVRGMTALDFYRLIECDVLQLGQNGLPGEMQFAWTEPCHTVPVQTQEEDLGDGRSACRTVTPWGVLTSEFKHGRHVKHPVRNLQELRILKRLWADTRCEPTPGAAESERRVMQAVGDRGIYVPALPPSPVQHLIEFDMGIEAFYFLLADHAKEMNELLELMQARRLEAYEAVAMHSRAKALVAIENTSTTLVSPAVYRQYSLPHIQGFVEVAHRYGKQAILHMCGLLKGLLPTVRDTGLDGINGLTPPPVGDTPCELALDVLGPDLVLLGAVFDQGVFQREGVTAAEIHGALERLYTPRLREAHMLLWLQADGTPTPLDRFQAVRDWMARHGTN